MRSRQKKAVIHSKRWQLSFLKRNKKAVILLKNYTIDDDVFFNGAAFTGRNTLNIQIFIHGNPQALRGE